MFNINGMGYLGYTAILQRDYPVALGILVIDSVLPLIGSILSDMIARSHVTPHQVQMTDQDRTVEGCSTDAGLARAEYPIPFSARPPNTPPGCARRSSRFFEGA